MRIYDARKCIAGDIGVGWTSAEGYFLIRDKSNAKRPRAYLVTSSGVTCYEHIAAYEMINAIKRVMPSFSVKTCLEEQGVCDLGAI